jgi:FkbM family methyltransferase
MSEPTTPPQGIFFRDFSTSYIPHILKEMYLDNVYAPYLDYIKDGIVLDVGGNVGIFTQFALQHGAKHVYIVEPSRDHVEVIRYMLKHNGLEDKVTVIPHALSHENGQMDLLHSMNVTAHSLYPGMNNAGTVEQVRTLTLDVLMKEYKVDHFNFIKLDPEGAEGQIIGSSSFRDAVPHIDAMVAEFHSWGGYSYPLIVNTLRDYGYKVQKMSTEAYVVGCSK